MARSFLNYHRWSHGLIRGASPLVPMPTAAYLYFFQMRVPSDQPASSLALCFASTLLQLAWATYLLA
jgi:hypothetical protein